MPCAACQVPLLARGLFLRTSRMYQTQRRALSASAEQDHFHTYHVKAKTAASNKCSTDIETATGHQLRTDVPRAMGGKDTAAQPVETLLAALAGCTQATALFVGRQMKPRISVKQLEMEFRAERDVRGALSLPIDQDPAFPARLARVHGTIRVHAMKQLSQDQLALLQHQTELRCPIANMLVASGCDMSGLIWVDGTVAED